MPRQYRRRTPRAPKSSAEPIHDDQSSDNGKCFHSSLWDSCDSLSERPADLTAAPDLSLGRRFHPENIYPDHFGIEGIENPRAPIVNLSCPGSKRKCPHCDRHVYHTGCIVIAIDGACSNNGKTGARSSMGVYYGPGHTMNVSSRLVWDAHTNQVAELLACHEALHTVREIQPDWSQIEGDSLSTVVIKSDSEYVVRGLTEWLPKWVKNGWKNSRGLPVANEFLFHMIEAVIRDLEEKSVCIKFWLVPREYNKEADSLAKAALKA